jgi:hypothetical protein
MQTKICNTCKMEKTIDQFHKDKSGRLGVRNTCKDCSKTYNAKWRKDHPNYSDEYHATHLEQEQAYAENRKPIRQAKDRVRYAQNTTKIRAYKRERKYGITDQQYNEILALQKGVCAICHQPETRTNKWDHLILPLAVDHDHETDRVRGLLCHNCNIALGNFQDDPQRLIVASEYLLTNHTLDDILGVSS